MAYLRARRSIKVAPGFKVNLNKRSVGVTVGTRGAHYSVNTSGRRTSTVGLPGTGLSIVNYQGGHRSSRPARQGHGATCEREAVLRHQGKAPRRRVCLPPRAGLREGPRPPPTRAS